MNKVFLMGRIGTDPQMKTFDNGGQLAEFSLATDESYNDKNGNRVEKTCWHNVVVNGKRAEVVMGYLSKGSKIVVEGSIDNQSYEKNGEKRIASKVRMLNFHFADSKKQDDGLAGQVKSGNQPASDKGIPF